MKTTFNKLSVVILAGGMGSRYNGQKQIDPVGPNKESLMEYSIFDALSVGIKHFVFVINDKFEDKTRKYFKKIIADKGGFVEFVLQTTYSSVPKEYYKDISERTKPWGTGHALLLVKNHLKNPFVIINADDFYGKEAFKLAASFVNNNKISPNKYGIIAYQLDKTLSENGSVSRGICKIKDDFLIEVVERTNIYKTNKHIVFETEDLLHELLPETLVSMNFWILHPSIFNSLNFKFEKFIIENYKSSTKEFFLPQVINEAILENKVSILALTTSEKWFGMTYENDKEIVVNEILNKVNSGNYPEKLWM